MLEWLMQALQTGWLQVGNTARMKASRWIVEWLPAGRGNKLRSVDG